MADENNYYYDDLECNNITDNIITYYQSIQDDDEEEVKKITSKIIGYFMRMGFDDMSMSTIDLRDNVRRFSEKIINNFNNLKEHRK